MGRRIRFDATPAELNLVERMVDRADKLAKLHDFDWQVDRLDLTLDLVACHCNGCPLRMTELLAADDGNFAHDVFGIRKHMDRDTGQLTGHFLPRYWDSESPRKSA